jgi:hypothetical protein
MRRNLLALTPEERLELGELVNFEYVDRIRQNAKAYQNYIKRNRHLRRTAIVDGKYIPLDPRQPTLQE